MEELKFCRKCNIWKPISEFYKDTRGGCRACVRKYQNEWSTAHRVHKRPVIPEGMRLCKRCGEMKSRDEFYKDKTNVSGYHHYCKVCTDSSRKTRREKAKKPKSILPEGHKHCPGCKRVLPLEKFSYLKTRRCYKTRCKDCDREYKKTHRDQVNAAERKRLSDPETKAARLAYRKEWRKKPEVRAKEIEYRKTHPTKRVKRVRELVEKPTLPLETMPDEHFTSTQWRKLLDLCNWSCVLCGSQFELSRDHIIPQSWGGSDKIENIQPLCRKHNMQKNDCYAVDYRPLLARAWAYLETYGTMEEWVSYVTGVEVEVQA